MSVFSVKLNAGAMQGAIKVARGELLCTPVRWRPCLVIKLVHSVSNCRSCRQRQRLWPMLAFGFQSWLNMSACGLARSCLGAFKGCPSWRRISPSQAL